MALHATIIVPDGTTDELLGQARLESLLALAERIADYKHRMDDAEIPFGDYWKERHKRVSLAYEILSSAGFTSLVP